MIYDSSIQYLNDFNFNFLCFYVLYFCLGAKDPLAPLWPQAWFYMAVSIHVMHLG